MTSSTNSQAFGYPDYVSNGVDTRTGQYSLAINLPDTQSNDLSGPGYSFALKFNPMNISNTGFGHGWDLNLTQFTPHNKILYLSSGETFKQTSTTPDGKPLFKENKLDTFHFQDNGDGTYRIAHKTGLVEILKTIGGSDDRVAVPHEIYAPSGHKISLAYENFSGRQTLKSVSDAKGTLLLIERNPGGTLVSIHTRPYDGADGGPLATYSLIVKAEELKEIILPTEEKASWRLSYERIRGILCVKQVDTPTGAREMLEYLDEGHSMPGAPLRPNLPRVTRHRTDPGFGQPIMEVTFRYHSKDTNRGHNFLGYGANTSIEEGLDPLYNVTHTYEYGTTAELIDDVLVDGDVVRQAVRSVVRTFSRFHALTEEITTQDHCVKREVITYYAENIPFELQPVQFQLPKEVKIIWQLDNDTSAYREEVTSSRYDTNGNPIEKTDSDGVTTLYTFYPKEGAEGCPADPENFQRHLKELTVIPSPAGHAGAPTLRTRYRYEALAAISGSGLPDRLMISSETLLQVDLQGNNEVELKKVVGQYFNDPDDALLHGRQRRHSETVNGKTTTTEYEYRTLVSELAGEPVLETVETLIGFDHVAGSNEVKKAIPRQDSLITGQPVVTSDENNLQSLIRYDALGRVTSETVAPGDPDFEGTRTYEYALVSTAGQQAWQVLTDIKGVKILTRFDGLNRSLYMARKDPDRTHDSDDGYLQTYAADYDAMGNLVSQTSTDWLGDTPLALTSRFAYDAWGEQSRVTGPDGVTMVSDLSPFGKEGTIARNWQESAEQPPTVSGLSESETNRFGKPVYVRRYDAQPLNERLLAAKGHSQPLDVIAQLNASLLNRELPIVGTTEYSYNGLGSAIEQTEFLDDDLERTNQYEYDVWGRMVRTTLPDKTVVIRTFAEHVTGELPITLQVEPANTARPVVAVGEQVFDGLLRQTRLTVGGRVEQYRYVGGQMQVSKRITPSNREIDYQYDLKISEQPKALQTPEGELSYVFDRQSAKITRADNDQGNQHYVYSAAGLLLSETWTDNTVTHEVSYVSSLQGLALSRSQTVGPDTEYEYDDCGRPKSVTQGTLRADFEYNPRGQQSRITTKDLHTGRTLVTYAEYDSLNREVLRTLSVTGQPMQTIRQEWLADDQLKSRHLEAGGRSQLREQFGYDLLGRLTSHTCSGATLPKDAYGNAYTRQIFRFDSLNNIEQCHTQFANGQADLASFIYSPVDPCQLREVTHSYTAGGYAATQTFDYDADGNMLNDEQGQRLRYDSLGRLLEVKDASGTQSLSTYRYDGHNQLIGVRQGNQSETLRFYEGYSLSHPLQDDEHIHYLFHGSQPLGQQQLKGHGQTDHDQTMLLLTDASPSVIGESLQGVVNTAVYTAYGARSANDGELQTLLAFNGEVREVNGWSLLGRGYRAYNPVMMRFHSPDSESPFGVGGLNAYKYCLANPVNFRDPSGQNGEGRPSDDYIFPIEQPKVSGLQKWLPLGAAILGAVFAIIATPFTGGASLTGAAAAFMMVSKVLGYTALALATASVGVTVWGIIEEDDDTVAIGHWLGYGAVAAGALTGIARGITAKLVERSLKAAINRFTANMDEVIGILAKGMRNLNLTGAPATANTGVATRGALLATRPAGVGNPAANFTPSHTRFPPKAPTISSAPLTSTPAPTPQVAAPASSGPSLRPTPRPAVRSNPPPAQPSADSLPMRPGMAARLAQDNSKSVLNQGAPEMRNRGLITTEGGVRSTLF